MPELWSKGDYGLQLYLYSRCEYLDVLGMLLVLLEHPEAQLAD